MLSLLASLHNAAKDDPVTDVFSAHAAVWPTGLASKASLQERQTEELLCLALANGMAAHPQDATMLRMKADLQFAAGRHSAALSLYLESVAVKTDFFQVLHGVFSLAHLMVYHLFSLTAVHQPGCWRRRW